MTVDFAHTREAEENRDKKARALALEARWLGFMPFELRTTGGTEGDSTRRDQVRRAAGLDRAPSAETWTRALEELELAAFRVPGVVMCPACDWAVLRVTTVGGKQIDLDPFPRDDGSVSLEAQRHGDVVAVVYAGGASDRPVDGSLYRQHSRSCPASPAGRRLRVKRCTACARPLWQALVERDPTYTSHPTCEPDP